MKKLLLLSFIMMTILVGGCTSSNRVDSNLPPINDNDKDKIFCSQDAKECPDGTFVSRNPENNCEFEPCPEIEKCDAVKECLKGKSCYKFENEDSPICYIGDPCNKCPSGKCLQAESYPPQIICDK